MQCCGENISHSCKFNTLLIKGDEQEKSRDRNYKRTRRFQGRIAGNQVMF